MQNLDSATRAGARIDAIGHDLTTANAYDFWGWSLAHYARPGTESLLLRLQDDFDCNVNILLWSCWCAERFDAAPEPVIRKAIDITAVWDANVTGKLREVRRYMKTTSAQQIGAGLADMRAKVKQAELDAEQVEQSLLQDLAASALAPANEDNKSAIEARARRNLAAYAALIGAVQKKGFATTLLHDLIDNIFGGPFPGYPGATPVDTEQCNE